MKFNGVGEPRGLEQSPSGGNPRAESPCIAHALHSDDTSYFTVCPRTKQAHKSHQQPGNDDCKLQTQTRQQPLQARQCLAEEIRDSWPWRRAKLQIGPKLACWSWHLSTLDRGGGGCMGRCEEDTPNHCSVGASRLSGLTIKNAYLEDCNRVGAGASNVEAFLLQGVVSCETVR